MGVRMANTDHSEPGITYCLHQLAYLAPLNLHRYVSIGLTLMSTTNRFEQINVLLNEGEYIG